MDFTNPLFVNHIRVTLLTSALFFHILSLRFKEKNKSLTKEVLNEQFEKRTDRYKEKVYKEHSRVCNLELASNLLAYVLVMIGMIFPLVFPFGLF